MVGRVFWLVIGLAFFVLVETSVVLFVIAMVRVGDASGARTVREIRVRRCPPPRARRLRVRRGPCHR